MSDSASTIDKEPADAELVKKNGSSFDASSVNKEEGSDSGGSSAKENDRDSSLHTRVNSAIETMLMNKNGKKVVYISDGPMKGDAAGSTATNDRERETTVGNSNSGVGMKGNLLHYSEPLLISARYRTEHSLDRAERTGGSAPSSGREERAGTIVVRSRDFGREYGSREYGGGRELARDPNQMDYPPHYRLSYHPNLYSKRSLPKASELEAERENESNLKSNNEKRPASAFVYSNFPANLIEVPTKQQVYFNSDDPLFETGRPLVDRKHLGKNTKYDDFAGRSVSASEFDRRGKRRPSNDLIPSSYPRSIRYNPSSSTPNLSSSSQLTNQPAGSSSVPAGALDDYRSTSSESSLHVKNQQKSNVISQLIRVQQPVVVKSTSVTYDSI